MNFEKLFNILEKELPNKIKNNKGLNYFAKNRNKFEGWLKVEICNILAHYSDKEILPEKDRIDIVFNNQWALELKTINTSYKETRVIDKTKPLTENINSVLKDIEKLQNIVKYNKKAVIFIVFPLQEKHYSTFQQHLSKIKEKTEMLKEISIYFNNGISAKLFIGLIK